MKTHPGEVCYTPIDAGKIKMGLDHSGKLEARVPLLGLTWLPLLVAQHHLRNSDIERSRELEFLEP